MEQYMLLLLVAFLLIGVKWSYSPRTSTLVREEPKEKKRMKSMCSEAVTQMGPGQHVVSYVFYVHETVYKLKGEMSTANKYLRLKDHIATRILEVYPGWRMRLYTDVIEKEEQFPYIMEALRNFTDTYDHVDLCDVRYIKTSDVFPGDHWAPKDIPIHEIVQYGMFWRFLPLGDPTVDRFISRDLDAYILDREVQPVKDWIRSGKQFHVMRDIQSHKGIMPGGLWGAQNIVDRELAYDLRAAVLTEAVGKYGYRSDIGALRQTLWPVINGRNLTYINDAFRCRRPKFGTSSSMHPFPTQREDFTWVGISPKRMHHRVLARVKCPKKCRPEEHKDWKYC